MYVGFIVDNKRDTRNGCLRNVLCIQVISLRTAVHDELLSSRTSFSLSRNIPILQVFVTILVKNNLKNNPKMLD